VVVLWSRTSVASDWVKTEASEAVQRRILVPVLADDVKIPLEFRRIQTVRLTDWEQFASNREWDSLCQAVAALVGQPLPQAEVPVASREPARTHRWLAGGVIGALLSIGMLAVTLSPSPPSPDAATPVADTPAPVSNIPAAPSPITAEAPAAVQAARAVTASGSPLRAQSSTTSGRPMRDHPDTAGSVRPPANAGGPPAANVGGPTTASKSLSGASSAVVPLPSNNLEVAASTAPHDPADSSGTARATAGQDIEPATFQVTHTHGVFRDQLGRLSVSPAGFRYRAEGGSTGTAFDITCRDLREVTTLNAIVDRQQRMLEITLRDRSYRFGTASTSVRDDVVTALTRACGSR
jgi:hypothetical protein